MFSVHIFVLQICVRRGGMIRIGHQSILGFCQMNWVHMERNVVRRVRAVNARGLYLECARVLLEF